MRNALRAKPPAAPRPPASQAKRPACPHVGEWGSWEGYCAILQREAKKGDWLVGKESVTGGWVTNRASNTLLGAQFPAFFERGRDCSCQITDYSSAPPRPPPIRAVAC